MLKKWRYLLGFSAVLTALLFVMSYLLQPVRITDDLWIDNRDRNALSIVNEPKDSIDVLVLGDSESFTAISPYRLWQKQKITSYVCGQTGQQISEAYYLMKRAFRKQHPNLVILETNELFTHAGIVEEMRMSVTEAGKYYLPVFSYHNRWKDMFSSSKAAAIPPDEISYKGFEIRKGSRPCEAINHGEEENPQSLFFSIRYYLQKIQDFCVSHDACLLLVSVPSPKNWSEEKHQVVAEYAKAEGIEFLDLNPLSEELNMDWQTDSYDGGDHLNLQGAEKVTDYLGHYLKERYEFFRSAEDQDAASSWKNGLEEYLNRV